MKWINILMRDALVNFHAIKKIRSHDVTTLVTKRIAGALHVLQQIQRVVLRAKDNLT